MHRYNSAGMPIIRLSHILYFLVTVLFGVASESAQAADCLECHKDLTEGKVVHAAVQMGCEGCHTGVDASAIPHKFIGNKGLKAQPPTLCYECHSKDTFTKLNRHVPVAKGMCLSCHTPHSGPNDALLLKDAYHLCLQCHENVDKKPHAVFGSPPQSHALRGREDPKREGKPFDCLSCHLPHSSAWGKLFRYEAQDTAGLCKNCHDFM
jgi:predicted CXXCH cytochrome family protein